MIDVNIAFMFIINVNFMPFMFKQSGRHSQMSLIYVREKRSDKLFDDAAISCTTVGYT